MRLFALHADRSCMFCAPLLKNQQKRVKRVIILCMHEKQRPGPCPSSWLVQTPAPHLLRCTWQVDCPRAGYACWRKYIVV